MDKHSSLLCVIDRGQKEFYIIVVEVLKHTNFLRQGSKTANSSPQLTHLKINLWTNTLAYFVSSKKGKKRVLYHLHQEAEFRSAGLKRVPEDSETLGQCHKTFYVRNLHIYVIS